MSPAARALGWLDERLGVSDAARYLARKTVPVHRYSSFYLLGGATLFLLVVQASTGVLLMFYYHPSVREAHESVEFIATEVPFGWLVRSLHAWSAHLVIFVALLHLVTVFFTRAYRKPRELTWITGCVMLFLLLGFAFTGYLLPWSQIGFFATQVAAGMAGWTPLLGEWMERLLTGGDRMGGLTLSRFYALHVFVLPMLTIAFLAAHLHLVQRHGVSVPPRVAAKGGKIRSLDFFPDFALVDSLCWLLLVAAALVLATEFPLELGDKADPFAPAPENTRPEWYFMFLFQSLRLAPSGGIAGVPFETVLFLLLNAGSLVLFLVPFLDRAGDAERSRVTPAGAIALCSVVILTAWGYRSLEPLIVAALTLAALWLVVVATARRRGSRGW